MTGVVNVADLAVGPHGNVALDREVDQEDESSAIARVLAERVVVSQRVGERVGELRLAGERMPARRPIAAAAVEPLTRQEGEVLDLVRAGLSNRDIAERLVLSVKTVEGHLTTIYGKLGVASRAQALALLADAPPQASDADANRPEAHR